MSFAVFPDGDRIAVGAVDGAVTIWNMRSGAIKHMLLGHGFPIGSLELSRDGHTLASSDIEGSIQVWRLG